MSGEHPEFDAELEALLDAGDPQRLAAAMQDEPALGEAVALQQAIDASLRRAFAVPDLEALHQRIEEAAEVRAVVSSTATRPRPTSWLHSPVWTVVATAAAIVVAVLLGKWRLDSTRVESLGPVAVSEPVVIPKSPVAPSVAPGIDPGSEPGTDCSADPPTVASRWIDLYHGLPPEGFGPGGLPADGFDEGSCASDGSSALSVQPNMGVSVRSECGTTPDCAQWGIEASRVLELSVEPQGMRVLVFVYSGLEDPRPAAPSDSRFYLHRRQLGHLVLYELSPLQRAVALPAMVQ